MAPNPNSNSNTKKPSSQFLNMAVPILDDDDDFQDCPSSSFSTASRRASSQPSRLNPLASTTLRPSEKPRKRRFVNLGKENHPFGVAEADLVGGLDSIEPTLDLLNPNGSSDYLLCKSSVEPALLRPCGDDGERNCNEEFPEENSKLDVLLKLCADVDEQNDGDGTDLEDKSVGLICCPVCGADISELSDDMRQVHTNECLDLVKDPSEVAAATDDRGENQCPGQVVDGSPNKPETKSVDVSRVVEWLRDLGLGKYEEFFIKQEIDWDALQWLTEEDLCDIGITALGPRKKILNSLLNTRNDLSGPTEPKTAVSRVLADETKLATNKLITDYFSSPPSNQKSGAVTNNCHINVRQNRKNSNGTGRSTEGKDSLRNRKQKDAPRWCCIPGTPFRVDSFKHLRRECSHWFLSHFHFDRKSD